MLEMYHILCRLRSDCVFRWMAGDAEAIEQQKGYEQLIEHIRPILFG